MYLGKKNSKNLEYYINIFKKIHGDKYDYSKVEYVNNQTKVCIVCPEHGEFWQTPMKHLVGRGCPKCGKLSSSSSRTMERNEFIKKSNEIHDNKYADSFIKTILKAIFKMVLIVFTVPFLNFLIW